MTVADRVLEWARSREGRLGRLARRADAIRNRMEEDRAWFVAAGLAFYWLLSAIPAFVAAVSLYALFADPATMVRHVEYWTHALPDEVERLVVGQILHVANATSSGIGIALAAGVIALVWSSSRGARGLMDALNIVFDVEDDRPMVRRRLVAFGVAGLGIAAGAISLGGIAVVSQTLGLGGGVLGTVLGVGRWPLTVVVMLVTLAVAYRYGPNRQLDMGLRLVSVGAVIATGLWVVATVLLAGYAVVIGFGGMYGALGAVVVLELWAFVTAFVVLLGAYVNAELED